MATCACSYCIKFQGAANLLELKAARKLLTDRDYKLQIQCTLKTWRSRLMKPGGRLQRLTRVPSSSGSWHQRWPGFHRRVHCCRIGCRSGQTACPPARITPQVCMHYSHASSDALACMHACNCANVVSNSTPHYTVTDKPENNCARHQYGCTRMLSPSKVPYLCESWSNVGIGEDALGRG